MGARDAMRAVGRARTAAILRALEMRLRRHGGRLDLSVHPTARIDGPIELRTSTAGEGPWELAIELGPHAWLGRGIGIDLGRGRSTIRLADGSQLLSGVRLKVRDGEASFGTRAIVREYSSLHVAGLLELGTEAMIGSGCHVHCEERVELGEQSALAHAVTAIDHDHAVDGGSEWWPRQPLAIEPVVIGPNTIVSAGARVLRGARLGRNSLVSANAVVRAGEYPDGSLLVGAPARVVRSLP